MQLQRYNSGLNASLVHAELKPLFTRHGNQIRLKNKHFEYFWKELENRTFLNYVILALIVESYVRDIEYEPYVRNQRKNVFNI